MGLSSEWLLGLYLASKVLLVHCQGLACWLSPGRAMCVVSQPGAPKVSVWG